MATKKAGYDYAQRAALVTGASRGIGAAIARLLAARGIAALVLVARSRGEMDALADEIRSRHGTRVEVIAADLTDEADVARIKEETDRRGIRVDLLVNNAGFGSHGPFEKADLEREARMIALNVAAPVRLTHHYLADMVARGHGAILNVASTAAFQPVPYMATYGATKAFVLSFSEALWAESRDRGGDAADVRVVCLCPGGTDTSFDFGAGAASRGRFENTPQSTPEEVAEAGLRALEGDASYVVVGRANYAAALGTRVLPRSAVARLTAALFRPAKDGGRASTRGRARRALTRGGAIVLAGAAAAAAIRLTAARRR